MKQPSHSGRHAAAEALPFGQPHEVVSAVRILPECEQRVIELRFGFEGEQHSLAAAGRKLGITRVHARKLERKALAKLARTLATTAVGESRRGPTELPRAA